MRKIDVIRTLLVLPRQTERIGPDAALDMTAASLHLEFATLPGPVQEGLRWSGAQPAASKHWRDAAPDVLRVIGEGMGWDYGAFWTVASDANVLRCEETWSAPSVAVTRFIATRREAAFAPGQGMPGSVWASGEPRWVIDIATEACWPT